jgi:hypothetical protein
VPKVGIVPMEEAAAMHRAIESRKAAGKLVLAMTS